MKGGENIQNSVIQAKPNGSKGLRRQTSSTCNENINNAQFTDPFLQIIMRLQTQSLDQRPQPADRTFSSIGAEQFSELTALIQNSSAGVTALLNTVKNTFAQAETGLNSDSDANTAILLSLQAVESPDADTGLNSVSTANNTGQPFLKLEAQAVTSAQEAFTIPLKTEANILPTDYSNQSSQTSALSDSSLLGKSANEAGMAAISPDALTQMTGETGLPNKDDLQSVLKNAGIEVISEESVSVQRGLPEAAVKAKQLLSNDLSQQNNQDDIDVDKLQNDLVKADTAPLFERRLEAVGNLDNTKVQEQITDAVKQNISLDKSDFTIKLKPENLGEIVVKLVEEEGKTTLTITTASMHTAKLINSEIDALRQAVAPMNVEVRHAVVSTNETASGTMQQFNMTGQQFTQQQFTHQQNFYQMAQTISGQTDSQTPEDSYASSQATQMKALLGKQLDAYI